MAATEQSISSPCPYCGKSKTTFWAKERSFFVVRCDECDYLYMDPRPTEDERDKSVRSGKHEVGGEIDISERHAPKKVEQFKAVFQKTFSDVWRAGKPITWIDVGAGYGEIVEAVTSLAPKGSRIIGLEPMLPKARAAKARGLDIIADYLGPSVPKSQFASVVNVFSHIYDFDSFIKQVYDALEENGQLFVETGNAADLMSRNEFPGVLGLPDHVAFAGEKHIIGFIERNGFEIISVERASIDGYIYTLKNIVKRLIGRDVKVMLPYSSKYRTLRIRAKKR